MEQVEAIAVHLRALLGERDQRRVKLPNQRVDGAVAGDRPLLSLGNRSDLTGDRRGAGTRLLERQPFDQELEVGGKPTPPSIGANGTRQANQASLPILPHPVSGRAQGDTVLPSDPSQRDSVLKMQAKELEAL